MATRTSTGLAVAQKTVHTSGTDLTGFSTLTGKPSRSKITNECPAAIARAFTTARLVSSSSFPDLRTSRGGRGLAEREAKPEMRTHPGQRLVQILHGLDEMSLADDDIHVVRLLHGNRFEPDRQVSHRAHRFCPALSQLAC